VDLVGRYDHQNERIDEATAIAKLRRACEGPGADDSCSELLFREVPPLHFALGDSKSFDATMLRVAERACFLGHAHPPLLGFGPTACFYVARAALDGLAGQAKDTSRAALALEAACEQELEYGPVKGGPSCY
jgi:hypothetical protein